MHSSFVLNAKPGPNAFKKPVPRIVQPIDIMKIPVEFLPDMMNRGKRMQLWRDEMATAVVPVWFKYHDKKPKERAYLYVKDKVQWAAWGEPIDDNEEMQKYLESLEEEAKSHPQQSAGLTTESTKSIANEENELARLASDYSATDTDETGEDDETGPIWTPPPANTIIWTTVMGLPCISLGDLCQARLKNKQSDEIVYYSSLRVCDAGLAFRLMSPEFSLVRKIEVERTHLPMGDYWREWRRQQIERQQQAFETWFRGYYKTHKPAVFKTSESCFMPASMGRKRKRNAKADDHLERMRAFCITADDGSPIQLLEPEVSNISPTWPRGVLRRGRSTQVRQWCDRFVEERRCPSCGTRKPRLVQRHADDKIEYCCYVCKATLGWSAIADSDDEDTSASESVVPHTNRDEILNLPKELAPDELESIQSDAFSEDFEEEDDYASNMLATPEGTPEPATDDVTRSKLAPVVETVQAESLDASPTQDEITSLRSQVKELACNLQELKAANKRLVEDYMEYVNGEANLLHQISMPFVDKPIAPCTPLSAGKHASIANECGQRTESGQKSSWWPGWLFRQKV